MSHSVQICFVVYLLHLSIYDAAYVLSFLFLLMAYALILTGPYIFPQLLVSQLPSMDRFTHGEQA